MQELSASQIELVSGGEKADFSDVTVTVTSTEEIVDDTADYMKLALCFYTGQCLY